MRNFHLSIWLSNFNNVLSTRFDTNFCIIFMQNRGKWQFYCATGPHLFFYLKVYVLLKFGKKSKKYKFFLFKAVSKTIYKNFQANLVN